MILTLYQLRIASSWTLLGNRLEFFLIISISLSAHCICTKKAPFACIGLVSLPLGAYLSLYLSVKTNNKAYHNKLLVTDRTTILFSNFRFFLYQIPFTSIHFLFVFLKNYSWLVTVCSLSHVTLVIITK